MSRPVVSVFDIENADNVVTTVSLPAVFTAPIRNDIVHYVHTLMAKNARQAYAVSEKAGHQVSDSLNSMEILSVTYVIVVSSVDSC